jgi:hypothetical protein
LTVDGPGSGLNADLLDGIDSTGFWQLGGNASTTPATDFLGTTDDQPLNFRVNGSLALRLEPALDGLTPAPNVIAGSPDNVVAADVYSATIGGGGLSANLDPSTANAVGATGGTVAGGLDNKANGIASTVSGGIGNSATEGYSVVAGGEDNVASGVYASVAGGRSNSATGSQSIVAGGLLSTASGTNASVLGGLNNSATGQFSTVGGGVDNVASGTFSGVFGGQLNTASGLRSLALGGFGNVAAAPFSYALGSKANVTSTHGGSFVYSDVSPDPFSSEVSNEFAVRASGGLRFRTSADSSTGCNLPAGSGVFSCTSDRNSKEGFEPLDGDTVLAKLAEVPVTSWTFKADPSGTRHVGPTAQDFYAAFGLGEDARSISTTDVSGIALAAIQRLAEKTEAQDRKIADLEARLSALED